MRERRSARPRPADGARGRSLPAAAMNGGGCAAHFARRPLWRRHTSRMNEVENQILESNELRREIDKLTMENKLLHSLCHSSSFEIKNKNSSAKNRRRSMAPRSISTFSSPTIPIQLDSKNHLQITYLQEKVFELENLLKTAETEITDLNKRIVMLKQQLGTSKQTIPRMNNHNNNIIHSFGSQEKKQRKAKLCFITSSKRYNILRNIDRHDFYNNFNCCHYITPDVGVDVLLKSIQEKLYGYNKQDYCVVMIGEADFRETQDYRALVKRIREALISINHTNIIIATPTYVCGALLYNSRVDIFNTLLNRDIYDYSFGYFFDSNDKLTHNLFSEFTGKIKDVGIQNILYYLAEKISSLRKTSDHVILPIKDVDPPPIRTRYLQKKQLFRV